MSLEVPAQVLGGGKIDLAIDGVTGSVVELKYPRGSRTGTSPDTMTAGELIRDFLRVALLPARDRWVAQVTSARLGRYMDGLSGRHDLTWTTSVGETLTLGRDALESLPNTAVAAIGSTHWLLPVTAICMSAVEAGPDLCLYAYRVAAPQDTALPAALAIRASQPGRGASPPGPPVRAPQQRGGARVEILNAIRQIVKRTGQPVVTLTQVVDEMRRAGSAYAESTVRTMMTSHMCCDSQGPGIGTYDDLERLGRGEYRLRASR